MKYCIATFVLLAGCVLDLSGRSADITGGSPCDGVQLDASHQYKPKSWTNARVAFSVGSLTFPIPASIPVTQGSGGTGHKVEFSFSLGGGDPTTCTYQSHGGTTYDFSKCKVKPLVENENSESEADDDGPGDPLPVAGTVVTADFFFLHV